MEKPSCRGVRLLQARACLAARGKTAGHERDRYGLGVPLTLPLVLEAGREAEAVAQLRRYYGLQLPSRDAYTGSAFDTWDSTGTRAADADRFTADDLVAVTFLSVEVTPRAAYQLLVSRATEFSALLEELGPDRDLAEVAEPLADEWAGWDLLGALRDLPGVGPTTASKLLARKRPRLRPVYDDVVARVMGVRERQWEPLRLALRDDGLRLHRRLLHLRDSAGLPAEVPALRVLDVLAWLQGKDAQGIS